MVAGHPLFHEGNIMEIMRQQISDPSTPLRDLIP